MTHTPTLALPGRAPPDERSPHIPNYRLLKRIGCGAFGTVWLAEESASPHYCAVKVLDAPSRDKADRAAMAERELTGVNAYRDCAKGHPHLIQIHATGLCTLTESHRPGTPAPRESLTLTLSQGERESSTAVYYVMEISDHAHGAQPSPACQYEPLTLKRLIRRKGRLPIDEAIEYARQLLDAVEHLHKAGIQHRDVKPDNCLFVGGLLKLADIGLVSSETAEAVGSPGYLPPEGKPDDLYALGKVLYEMVTGLRADKFPEWPGELRPPTDRRMSALRAAIVRLCHPQPELRPCDARQFAATLALPCAVSANSVASWRSRLSWLGVAAALGIGIGVGGDRAWVAANDPLRQQWAEKPADGSEYAQTMTFQGRNYWWGRGHLPGGEYTVGSMTSLRCWDLQTHLRQEEGVLVVSGAFQVQNQGNPLLRHPPTTQQGGEINQVYLKAGENLVLVYHGQQVAGSGHVGRFNRTIALEEVAQSPAGEVQVNLQLMSRYTPESAQSDIHTGRDASAGVIPIGRLKW